MEAHDAAVQAIASQVKSFHQRQAPFRIYHGATNSTRKSQRRADNTIDTSRLDHVLSVDAARRTALVEPNVPMDQLVHATLEEHGLVPPVVMEFPGITVGGGFSGTSGESSSFRHGAFDTTVESIEIVLPDGTLARASKTERTDVFWGAASAFGTLGVVTLLEVQLRPAKAYVRLAYSLCTSAEDAVAAMRRACADEANDFVDGIVFDMHTTLVCAGYLVDELPAGEKARTFTARSDPWFYIRARQVARQLKQQQQQEKTKTKTRNKDLSSSSPSSSSPPPPSSSTSSSSSSRAKHTTAPRKEGQDENDKRDQKGEKQAPSSVVVVVVDYIPLVDYLFRYDRGGFWVGKYSFAYFLTPFNRVTRFLLDRFMRTRVMYRAVHRSGLADYYMVQDVGVPLDRAAEFQRWLDDAFGIYPLWLCPLHVRRRWPDSHHGLHASFAAAAAAAAADDDPSSPSPPPPSGSGSCSQTGGGGGSSSSSSKGASTSADDLMNFGVWGPLPRGSSRRDVVALNRALERQVQQLGGKKWLYAHAYYPEDEFWQNYDRASYDALRARYAAQYLPSVYDKVRVDAPRAQGLRGRREGRRLSHAAERPGRERAGGALEGMRE
ncbi:FAD-binding, type 2 [Moelleriella libera RCEF 2490]|uniref:Delta(24)-sterol reductase n=1 Tax=Moelleriella libera RCEF 2490 TaxID=1081109 RepID=A0A168CHB4_9HYPO|nr:FAD-binding, type 2 [Moelleriella libera RCEF 2490]